jgi:hypothetical protein
MEDKRFSEYYTVCVNTNKNGSVFVRFGLFVFATDGYNRNSIFFCFV